MSVFSVETKWIIMSKDKKLIAKGVPRNRYLVSVDDTKDKKRILFYSSENMAKAAFTGGNGFYIKDDWTYKSSTWFADNLEAVKVQVTIEIQE